MNAEPSRATILPHEMAALLGRAMIAVAIVGISFNALRVAPHATAADVLLVGGACLLLAASIGKRSLKLGVPPWLLLSAGALFADSLLAATIDVGNSSANLIAAAEFCIALVGTPLVLMAGANTPKRAILFSAAFAVSAALDAAVAVSDWVGRTSIGPTVSGATFLGRTAGLSVHPNHLAIAAAMAVPIGFALLGLVTRMRKILVAVLVVASAGGILVSGSRAGLIAAVASLVALPLIQGKAHRAVWVVAALGAAFILIINVAPASGMLVAIERVTGAQSVGTSDVGRIQFYQQALMDFSTSPILGQGFSYVRNAHDIYLQLLQAGGVVGLIAFGIFAVASVATGIRLARDSEAGLAVRRLAAGLTSANLAWFVAGLAQNYIYDRYLYVPTGLLLALKLIARRQKQFGSDRDA